MITKGNELKLDTIEQSGVTIPYSWCHSRRKTLGISVRPDKTVAVRVPLRTSAKEIRRFVASHAEWVLKVWKKLDTRTAPQEQGYSRGAVFLFQGTQYQLEFAKGPRRSVVLHDGLLILITPEMPSEDAVRKTINSWYRKQALAATKERSEVCHRMMQAEVIPLPPITVRSMTTRWGSYSYRTKRISLNLNLIKAPVACLDYVIIHELCHIKVRHHGADFWRMVEKYVPDYFVVRKQLRGYI